MQSRMVILKYQKEILEFLKENFKSLIEMNINILDFFAIYIGYKFCSNDGEDNNFWIEPYSSDMYQSELLLSLGLVIRNTKRKEIIVIFVHLRLFIKKE